MVVFPNAKINLGLRVKSKRSDGYHELDTVFYPVNICDILEVVSLQASTTQSDEDVVFSHSGLNIPGNQSSNLCLKAYHLLKKEFPDIPPVQMHLHKKIPMGAGMGGGSADGAFTIRLLNDKFRLGMTDETMQAYAIQLGSDCPFFICNKPVSATGRGEIMEPVSCDLSSWDILIVNPGIHVGTAEAFRQIRLSPDAPSCKDIIQLPVEEWQNHLVNDFEQTVFTLYPALERLKSMLYETGASYASMTGSGSTVYGLFKTLPDWQAIIPQQYISFAIPKSI
jgi:4-diphosphocytidyl-2-C-methyl-D-erythritol kinase